MGKLFGWLMNKLDDYSIKKKFYLLYFLCILAPLIATDSVILHTAIRSEEMVRREGMEDMAAAVQYAVSSQIEQAVRLGKSIYKSRKINDFLDKEYEGNYEYVIAFQNLKEDTMVEDIAALDNITLTMYCDNPTITGGGNIFQLRSAEFSPWYEAFEESGRSDLLYFYYDTSKTSTLGAQRRMMYIRKMDMYGSEREKLLVVGLDYAGINRILKKMNYNTDIFFVSDGRIMLSNGDYASIGTDFEPLGDEMDIGCRIRMSAYGMDMDICVINTPTSLAEDVKRNLPIILLLIVLNAVFPIVMLAILHRSFTVRLRTLSDTFRNVDEESHVPISDAHGRDEIGSLMKSYNRMAERINSLIQIVYKDKIREQESTVARQKAELLALRSQINPHFLFNTLECIRMHSVLKKETETADMIENLAGLQRQYVDWGEDLIEISKEMEFVEAYLAIQKYRFGDRLNYELSVEEECRGYRIPKLTIVTFAENACVHGIEGKPAECWVFVRVWQKHGKVYLEIEDTGVGMDEVKMEQLLWKMQHASIELLQKKERVGIINACLRLKMLTEDTVSFELDGEEGLGLTVQIMFPITFLSKTEEPEVKNA